MFQAQRFTQLLDRIRQTLRPKRLRADYLLRRSILYVLLTILVVAGYALLVGGLSLIFGGVIAANNPWLIGLMVLVLALVLLPLRNWLQKGVDALLLRGQRAYQLQTYDRDFDFRWLEERLLPLNFRLVFLNLTPESFAAAREERLKVSGKLDQYKDLEIFVRKQELIERLVGESILPKFELDISDNDISRAVEKISDWMGSTGGLWAR